jgi:predicted GNAT family acetyltransferase
MNVADHPGDLRYEIDVDGAAAGFIDYRRSDGVVELVHTEVARESQGKGVGAALVQGALDDLRTQGVKVLPSCPFVAAYIRRHPEYEDLVAS